MSVIHVNFQRKSVEDMLDEAYELDEDPKTYTSAIKLYEQIIAIDSNHVDAMINLGNIYHKQGNTGEALRLYRQALLVDPDNKFALYNVGWELQDQGFMTAAEIFFSLVIKHDPNFADAYYLRAFCRMNSCDGSGAKMDFKKYLEFEPTSKYADEAKKMISKL